MKRLFECRGSYGALYVNRRGFVQRGVITDGPDGRDRPGIPPEYADHLRADLPDVREWYRALGANPESECHHLDITEVGWHLADRSYLPPSEITRHHQRARVLGVAP